jgi:hypothetical protein
MRIWFLKETVEPDEARPGDAGFFSLQTWGAFLRLAILENIG